jgi:hypothetical protein
MNLSNSFLENTLSLPFKDENGVTKFLIGAALIFAGGIIPILPTLFFLGYLYRIHHKVVNEKSGPVMPEWDDWGKLLTDGLKYLGAILVYMLPVLVLVIGGSAVMMVGSVGMAVVTEEASQNSETLIGLMMLLVILASFVLILVGTILGLLIGIVSPAGLVHMSSQDNFSAAFRINEWGKILRANLGGYLLAFLIIMGLSIITTIAAQFLYFTIILCLIMPFVMSAGSYYIGVVSANLFAEAYIKGQAKLEQPAAPPMLEDVSVI